MTDEKEKKPGFWKRWAARKADEIKPREDDGIRSYLGRNTASLHAGAGAAGMAIGSGIAFTGRAGVGLFRLAGRFTFLFVILAAFVHYLHITRQVATASVADIFLLWYIVLGVFASVFFWADPSDPFPVKRTVKFVLLALVAYLLPLLLQLALQHGLLNQQIAAFFTIFTPVLVIYAFMDPGDGLTRFVGALYFIFLTILLIVQVIFPVLEETGVQGPSVMVYTPEQVWASVKEGFASIGEKVDETQQAVTTQVKNGTKRVTQEIYTGQVDNSQQLPLGIQIIEPRALLQRFHIDSGDDVVATATIRARTINEDKPYVVKNECYLEFLSAQTGFSTAKVRVPGTVSPASFDISYTGEQYDQRLIECIVTKKDIDDVTKANPPVNVVAGSIIFNTTFDFTTSGYMTYAFMDRNLFSNLRSDQREPWREMGLQTQTMIAKYTPGPVMIGMPADTIPYPIDASATNLVLPSFGVTFSNAFVGRGGIEAFKETHLYVPKQMEVSSTCTPKEFSTEKSTSASGAKYGTDYQEYLVKNLVRESGEQYVTLRCPMTVAKAGDLLGPSGAGLYTLFLTTDYSYVIDATVPVTLWFPARTSTSGAGLVPNANVAANKAACKNGGPYCTGLPNDGFCYCYHQTAAAELGNCQWIWGTGKNDNAVSAVDGNGCFSTSIPSACATSGISCSGTACRCIYPVEGGSQDCTWDVRTTNAVTCAPYTRESS